MDKEKIDFYCQKYKKGARKVSIIAFCFIMLLGISIIAADAYLFFSKPTTDLIWLYVVLLLAGVADIGLDIKFIIYSIDHIKYMDKKEAVKRYMKITGTIE